MSNVTLPLLTLLIGAMLGVASSLLTLFVTHRRTIGLRLLDQFFEVRKELVEAVSPLSDLRSTEGLKEDCLIKHRRLIAKLYYEHFDFLPEPVADAVVLLHAALTNPDRGPYSLQQGGIVRMNHSDVVSFVERCSRFKN